MNNKVLYGVLFGLLMISSITLGMELDKTKDNNKSEYFSLFIKNNGSGVIKKCTIDYQKSKSSIVKQSESVHHLVKTMPIYCEKVKKIEDINFAVLGPLLDSGEKFCLTAQGNNDQQDRYEIDQVTVKSWPIQWDEIKNSKYGSVNKYLTSDSVVYDLYNKQSTDMPILRCAMVNEVQQSPGSEMTETLSSIALAALILYYYRNNLMVLSFFPKS